MKARKKSIEKDLPRTRLYLNDLQEIYDILKSHYTRVVIQTNEYEISDFDELRNIGASEIHELDFYCYPTNSWVFETSVNFDNSLAIVRMDEDTTLNRGILAELEQVIVRRKQRIASVWSNPVFSGCLLAIAFGISIWLAKVKPNAFLIVVPLSALANWFYWLWLSSHNYSVIALYERERPNFFARNKDRIIVGIIVGIVVAMISRLVT